VSRADRAHERRDDGGDRSYLVEIYVRHVFHLRIERLPSGLIVLAVSALQALWVWLVAR
jgi:hypothetical protein